MSLSPQTSLIPAWRTARSKVDEQWRYIQICAGLFMLVIACINWYIYSRCQSNTVGLAQSQEFRPALFPDGLPSLTSIKASAKVIDPGLFHGIPEEFNSSYGSPCWHVKESGELQCLPSFLVLGAFQSGTADLSKKMLKHPQIARTGNPQPHFWTEQRPTHMYLDVTKPAIAKVKESPKDTTIGDFSASYLAGYWAMQPRVHQAFYRIKAHCWSMCKNERATPEQRAERLACVTEKCYGPSQKEDRSEAHKAGLSYEQMQTPLLVRATYGTYRPKFVVMLRDPVDRVHSAFWTYGHYWERAGGKSAAGFLNFLREQTQGFRNCTDVEKQDVFHCAVYLESISQYLEDIFFHCDQLMRGMYSIWLHIWFSFFPRANFLVVQAEEYYREPRRVLGQIFDHLELREPTDEEWNTILAQSHINAAATGNDMLPEARALAHEFYQPFNHDLARLLGDPKWEWQ